MNQSAILAAVLLAGFGLYITSQDRLSVYARVLWGDKPEAHSKPEEEEEGFQFEDLFEPFGYLDLLKGVPALQDFNWNLNR